jgi:DNA-binding NarL/FixJ family response regulator
VRSGQPEAATGPLAAFEQLAALAGTAEPLAQLAYGETLRRARRRREARTHLREALGTFERLGAAPWAERAGAELRATGETARRRDPSTLSQIIRLVGEGGTNREIGAQLFLSRRTIDYHLRNVFVKLGVSSRAELIRLQLADR